MERNSLQRWEKEYNFIKGYATKYKMRNTLIALTLAIKYHTGQCRDGRRTIHYSSINGLQNFNIAKYRKSFARVV